MTTLFYTPNFSDTLVRLDEEESRHLSTVLRNKPGDRLRTTDGKGCFYEVELVEIGKKQAVVRLIEKTVVPTGRPARLHVAIAPNKQLDRFEWFLEKATEIGIDEITPLRCRRSERDTLRADRLEKILVAAMKQSMRAHLPKLNPLTPFEAFAQQTAAAQKFFAWCSDTPVPHLKTVLRGDLDTLLCIGPAGDFAPEEVAIAQTKGFHEVGLGETRLRTETAGLLGVACFNLASW